MVRELHFTTIAPVSKKNRGQIFKRPDGSRFWTPSKQVQQQSAQIAADAARVCGSGPPHFQDEDIELDLTFHTRSLRLDVVIRRIQAKPKGYTGRRRDLHSVIESLADALEGVAFANDNQISRIRLRRELD